MKFTKIVKSSKDYTYLVSAINNDKPCWYYVLSDKIKSIILENALIAGTEIDLTAYGKILKSGWGDEPASYIVDKIEREGAEFDNSELESYAGQTDKKFFLSGTDYSGKRFYSYAIVPANKVREFEVVMPYGGCDINDYGIVVETDFGTPSEELKQRMREEGFKHPEDA